MTRKLKSTEIKTTRDQLLKNNNFKCGLCGLPVLDNEAVHLDHDHKQGHVRDAIHARCNTTLGKLENHFVRAGFKTEEQKRESLMNVWAYIKLHETNQTNLIHSSHLTENERKAKAAKRRKAKAKAKAKENSKKET